jgi:hypothetical protein
MAKKDLDDAKSAEKQARKREKREKEARKQERQLKKEQKRRQKEARKQAVFSQSQDSDGDQMLVSPSSPSLVVSSSFLMKVPTTEEDLNSTVFYKKRMEVSLSLLPSAMGNVQAALEDSIRSMLLRYIKRVGMLLTFHDLEILSNNGHGMILDELPYLNYKVGFEGLVFCPKVGSKVGFSTIYCTGGIQPMLVLKCSKTQHPSSSSNISHVQY